jgi:hypothetical protein
MAVGRLLVAALYRGTAAARPTFAPSTGTSALGSSSQAVAVAAAALPWGSARRVRPGSVQSRVV